MTIKAGTQSATKVAAFRVQGAPVLSIADASATEANVGNTALSFPVKLSAPAATTVSVAYATADGFRCSPGDVRWSAARES